MISGCSCSCWMCSFHLSWSEYTCCWKHNVTGRWTATVTSLLSIRWHFANDWQAPRANHTVTAFFLHGNLLASRLEECAHGLPIISEDIQNAWNSALQIEEACMLLWEIMSECSEVSWRRRATLCPSNLGVCAKRWKTDAFLSRRLVQ